MAEGVMTGARVGLLVGFCCGCFVGFSFGFSVDGCSVDGSKVGEEDGDDSIVGSIVSPFFVGVWVLLIGFAVGRIVGFFSGLI